MKHKSIFGALAAVLLLAASSYASSLHLSRNVSFNGQEVKPGDYQVRYSGSGPDVEVSILQGKKVIAQSKGRLEERETKAPYDAFVTNDSGATPAITEIEFAGKKQVVVLGGADTEMHPTGK